MLNKNPKPRQYNPKNGNGYTTGKITDSILTRSKLLDTHTYSSIPDDDERLNHGSELLAKMRERNSIQDRIRSLTEGSIMNDTDRLYMGKDDNIDAADRVAVGRQSFFRNVNQFNVVSQKGRPISRMEESMLYK